VPPAAGRHPRSYASDEHDARVADDLAELLDEMEKKCREKGRSSNDEMLETTTALSSFFGLLARV
jgi:ElaB/YqjD/DUF883 family membrane-anchored ribosome-binding protein